MDTDLQKGMASDNAQEPFQAFSPVLDDLVRETVREHFSRERRNIDSGRFVLEDIAESLEIGVSATDEGVA
jgi:hypothetical protein